METLIFPRRDAPSFVCDYPGGADYGINENTDTAQKKFTYFVLFQAFALGLKTTIFNNPFYVNGSYLTPGETEAMHKIGLIDFQLYFPTDRWVDSGGGVPQIPDYYATQWTAAGVAAFSGAVLGAAKPARYPDHGQQMYEISGGVYGALPDGTIGSNGLREFDGLVEYCDGWLLNTIGRRPSVFSYRNGRNTSPFVYARHYLAGRNSDRTSRSFYGFSKVDGAKLGIPDDSVDLMAMINQTENTRWVDGIGNPSGTEATLRSYIQAARESRGIEVDFSHWHTAATNQKLEPLLNIFSSEILADPRRCAMDGYGNLFEYFWLRHFVDRSALTFKDGAAVITVQIEVPEFFKKRIYCDLWVQVDTAGTFMEGKDLVSSYKKIKKGPGSIIYVQVPPRNLATVEIKEGAGGFLPTAPPTISVTIGATSITVTTDQDTKCVLFRHLGTETIYEIQATAFSTELKKTHVFNTEGGYAYYVGAINEAGLTSRAEV